MFGILFLFSIMLLLIHWTYLYITHKKFMKAYTNGTWVDKDASVLVMKVDGDKIKVAFGISDEEDYEFVEDSYSYSMNKKLFSSSYIVKINQIKLEINPITGSAMVYKKQKFIGEYVKNNMLKLTNQS